MAVKKQLWDEYRGTWLEFSRQLDELQGFVAAGDREGIDAALGAVDVARLAHNAARDRLAELLTGEIAQSDSETRTDHQRVRETARLLWEFAGKPQGTADADWFRAERLVRAASEPVAVGK